MRLCLLMTLLGCNFKAAVEHGGGGPSGRDGDSGAADADTGDIDDDTPPEPTDPNRQDDDLDGYTEEEGDCDDDDAGVRPGLPDGCDGIDNDCDDEVDEDARDEDPFEPNDTIDYALGDLDEAGAFEIEAFLDAEDDVDRFNFVYTDSWIDVDSLTVELTNVGGDITYKMKIVNLDADEEVYSEFSTPDDEALSFELDGGFGSDSATFQVTISSLGGAGCTSPYVLDIVHGDWWGRP